MKHVFSSLVPPLLTTLARRFRRNILSRGFTGLNGLDRQLLKHLPQRPGFYVELGANDGVSQSNTYKLQYSFGWHGLLIEPSPIQYAQCVENRNFGVAPSIVCAACVPFEYLDEFVPIEYSNLMSIALGLEVPDEQVMAHAELGASFLPSKHHRHRFGAQARTLTAILAEVNAPSIIDLISLDVEGNELAVLRGLDFQRYSPRAILVEVRSRPIADYLNERGYSSHTILSDNGSYKDILFRL